MKLNDVDKFNDVFTLPHHCKLVYTASQKTVPYCFIAELLEQSFSADIAPLCFMRP